MSTENKTPTQEAANKDTDNAADTDSSNDTTTEKGVSTKSLSYWRTLVSYQGILLGVICAVVTLTLLVVNQQTKADIAARDREDSLQILDQVIPTDMHDNLPTEDVVQITDSKMGKEPVEIYLSKKDGRLNAVAYQTKSIGYGGAMTLMLGVDIEGNVLGVRVVRHKETPGLTNKMDIKKSDWITGFNGLSLSNTTEQEFHVKKDGGKIDQFTGATITPRAIVQGVYLGLKFFERHQAEIVSSAKSQTTGAAS